MRHLHACFPLPVRKHFRRDGALHHIRLAVSNGSALEEVIDYLRRLPGLADGRNRNIRAFIRRVAHCEHAGEGGGKRAFIRSDRAALCQLQRFKALRIRPLADRHDDGVERQILKRALHWNRPAPAARIRFAERHLLKPHAAHRAARTQNLHGIRQKLKATPSSSACAISNASAGISSRVRR